MLLEKKKVSIKMGTKEPIVVFLHGWGLSKEIWNNILSTIATKCTAYAIDLPAFGNNHHKHTIFTLDDYVEYLHNFLQQQHIDSCILVGHSFGGKVATLFALKYPKEVQKLILYSASLPIDQTQSKFSIFVRKGVVWISFVTRFIRYKKISRRDFKQLAIIHKTARKYQFKDSLTVIKQPVLLLAGRFDFISPLSYQYKLTKQFSNAKMVTFNRSTHLAHREERKKFIETVVSFIEE